MTSTEKTPIWLDCDPGHDDAFAIILAAEHPSFELLGISTVSGNAQLDRVTHNALSILTSIHRTSIPVHAGAGKPYMRPAVHAPEIHGITGIDGTDLLPEPSVPHRPENAIPAMHEAIMATRPRTCVLVATGTLTNVGLLLATFPDVADHVKEVSIMGGAFGTPQRRTSGNITEMAEFNVFCDPESAQCVFSNHRLSGRITLIPLDITHTVLATEDVLRRLLRGGGGGGGHGEEEEESGNFRKMLFELLTYFSETYANVFGITAGPPLHDPLAVAAVLPTDEIKWDMEEVRVEVVCHGEETGRTVKKYDAPEVRGTILGPGEGHGATTLVKIPRSLDVDAFWKVILDMISKADGRYVWP